MSIGQSTDCHQLYRRFHHWAAAERKMRGEELEAIFLNDAKEGTEQGDEGRRLVVPYSFVYVRCDP